MNSLWRAVRVFVGLVLRRPIVGVCIIPILPDGTVVLMRRRDSGLWGLPGGLMDWGEDVVTTAQRELAEETGLRVAQVGRLVGVYSSPYRDARFHSVCIAIEVHAIGIPKVKDAVEVLAVTPFPIDAVMELELAHDHARHLQDYLANQTVVA